MKETIAEMVLRDEPGNLAQLFDFTQDEITLNAAGQLSQRQHDKLMGNVSGRLVGSLGIVLLLAIPIFGMLFTKLHQWNGDLQTFLQGQFGNVLFFLLALILPITAIAVVIQWNISRHRILETSVKMVSGPVRFSDVLVVWQTGKHDYFIKFGDVSFRVTRRQQTSLTQDRSYTAYYVRTLPYANLLSIKAD